MVRAAQERSPAKAWMGPKAEAQQRRERARVRAQKAAKAQELKAVRWLPELRKRKPKPTELPEQEPVSLQLENPLVLVQEQGAARQQEQPGRSPRTVRALAQKMLRERIAWWKNILRPQQSQRAWAALGKGGPFVRQAFPAGGTWLPAWRLLARTK